MPNPRSKQPVTYVVLIKWADAAHQEDLTDPLGVMEAWTVGFLMKKTKAEYIVCRDVFADGEPRYILNIPHGMVKKVTKLMRIPGMRTVPQQESKKEPSKGITWFPK